MKKSQRIILFLTLMSAAGSHLVAEEQAKILQTPTVTLSPEKLEGDYDLQLYFGNSAPYLDGVRLERAADGQLRGRMHVPDDFDADLEKIQSNEASLRFEILVPANSSRPQDMVFLYEATISPHDTTKLAGHVTLTKTGEQVLEKPEYVGSFLLFKK